MFSWFLQRGTKQGIFWALMIYCVGSLNDVLMRFLGDRLHFIEISFFRFLFSSLTVVIPMLWSRQNLIKTNMHMMHFLRGLIGAVAIALCCLGVNIMPLAENTTILFSEALFMIPMSIIILKEHVSLRSWIATIVGFVGLIVMFRPSLDNFNCLAIVPTFAAFLFAVMSIMVKVMVDRKENELTMLFYFAVYTTLIAAIFVSFFWETPTYKEIMLLILLGVGANLIQLFLFLAYKATKASKISPIRYTELPFAILFGFIIFGQIPTITMVIGAILIISGTFISSYNEE